MRVLIALIVALGGLTVAVAMAAREAGKREDRHGRYFS